MSFYADHVYPPLLDRVSRRFDDQRRGLMAHAAGRVLELGVGTGSNLAFYPSSVELVVGVDPHPAVLDRAAERVRGRRGGEALPYPVRLQRADAAALPYAAESFDTVVAFLALCTIPDLPGAAREAYRVLRRRGRLLVMEHVKAPDGSRLLRWQRRLDPPWSVLAVGCHLDRDTGAALRAAGFDTARLERYRDDTWFPPASPRIRGVLRKT
ncbi:MAG: methyltransferase domain-containing protein [Gemmatimonadota bacterium]